MTVAAFPSGIADGVYWFFATVAIIPLVWGFVAFHVWAERQEDRQDEMRQKHRLGRVRPYDWGTDGL